MMVILLRTVLITVFSLHKKKTVVSKLPLFQPVLRLGLVERKSSNELNR
jgi:hypothetical protein